ncbi:VOC family protein [Dactylosporangium sp. CA-233914]|uniref:VOC family protein n=1 Tax=Dactylosporangium sp. CA-233914 TaxID=3239934 RepID=UPI003D92B6F0
MVNIHALGYLAVRGPHDEWKAFAQDVLGLQPSDAAPEGELRFRTDERAYRLIVEGAPKEQAGLAALGLELHSERDLEGLASDLHRRGHSTSDDPALAKARDVRRLITTTDPDGHVLELYYGAATNHRPFVSPQGVRFVTGDMGLGHVFMFCGDLTKTLDFYQDALGFALSDTIDLGPATAYFLHCNARHHSIAVAQIPDLSPGLGHLMLEVDSLSAVGRALDRAQEHGASLQTSIGEHTNDLMTSFYLDTPSGFQVEYGWDGRLVDDSTWTVGHYTSTSNWGHKRVLEDQSA